MEVPPIDRAGATDVHPIPPVPPAQPVAAPSVAQALESQPFPVPPAAAPQPAPPPPASPSLFVSFVGVNKKGKQRFGRMIVNGMFSPRQSAIIYAIENAIGKERDLSEVELLTWSLLEA